jgi:hypothetical protein
LHYGKPFKAFKKDHSIVIEMVRIFIAHSSKDEWLINPIASNLKLIPVEPIKIELKEVKPPKIVLKEKKEPQIRPDIEKILKNLLRKGENITS